VGFKTSEKEELMSMSIEDLERKIKILEDQLGSQEKKLRTLEDIEKIKRLQRAYGYYLEHWMAQEVIDLFSDGPNVSLMLADGTYLGKQGVIRYFESHNNASNEFLHQVMQVSGIIDVAEDGRTAKGQWYGFGAMALTIDEGVIERFMGGIYGADYIKEDGVWKFEKLRFDQVYNATPLRGWVNPERVAIVPSEKGSVVAAADIPRSYSPRYPSGYIFPFHFKHPVTGRETSEGAHNKALEDKKAQG
jgi:hypothetical protein